MTPMAQKYSNYKKQVAYIIPRTLAQKSSSTKKQAAYLIPMILMKFTDLDNLMDLTTKGMGHI